MSDTAVAAPPALGRMAADKARVAAIRDRARRLFEGGATGVQTAAALAEATDELVIDLFRRERADMSERDRDAIGRHAAVIAVGGSGRGELAPFSDADLLFLFRGSARRAFGDCASRAVRAVWDAGVKLGHSIRTPGETVAIARREPQVATALVDARLLCGSSELFAGFRRKFERSVVAGRRSGFIADCLRGRQEERVQFGSTVQQLQPDVKRSLGGLRDLHLIRWLGFARYGTSDLESLRLRGALSKEDARRLSAAHEFLLRIRIDLHFAAGRANDVLSRDEQLRITAQRRISERPGQRPVERFMQEYFRHTTAVSEIAERFSQLHAPRSLTARLKQFVMTHRTDEIFRVSDETIDVVPRHRQTVAASLEGILRLSYAALLNGVRPAPELVEQIRAGSAALPEAPSAEAAQSFLAILGCTGRLGDVLRSLAELGVLERLVPEFAHVRCLLQFNQYHRYTVDEHTLRAVEAAVAFDGDSGPIGVAYGEIRHKEILHLALLLHDLGKGYEEDHSDVGRRIAERTAARLGLPDHQRDALVFLVHKHLKMAHTAFRRDTSDPETLVPFSHEIGSPETLRMLYVLTAADLSAVGPGVWTTWKSELLTDLYDRLMVILSGRRYEYHQEQRLARIREHVQSAIAPPGEHHGAELRTWIDRQLEAFPPHYLGFTSPDQIAADLAAVRQLGPGDVRIEGRCDPEAGTVEYRVLAHGNLSEGCFHKTAGVLTAKRHDILSAQINTTTDGYVVDSFRVIDHDFCGAVPAERLEDVSQAIRRAMTGEGPALPVFQKKIRFSLERSNGSYSELPTRVVVDNHTSDRCTIIDVFAPDRPGLLYTISRAIYELELSVLLAKISTHVDQVVDVFYVTDLENCKIRNGEKLREIKARLEERLDEFLREPV
ncbi:MAG TPA: [protein-PII] uridylyltransferase [Planctomycetaceae bacterium]|nr:[protein-PII] uridylyltransferase [Planctomycetaceae bacterium]